MFRRFLLSWLSRWYRVTAVRDGFAALKWLQEGNVPDAVVLDMELPRVSGLQFLKNIRYSGLFSELPVVALSSDDAEATRARCAEFRVDAVFQKPYKPELLLGAIRAAASRAGRPGRPAALARA